MKIPELFKEIIRHDAMKPDTSGKVVTLAKLHRLKAWQKRKNELIVAAERYVARQKWS